MGGSVCCVERRRGVWVQEIEIKKRKKTRY